MQIFDAALRAAAPRQCIQRVLSLTNEALVIGGQRFSLKPDARLIVIGGGKATPAMAAAVEQICGDRITAGAINTKYGHTLPLNTIRTVECGHPLPDAAGVEGTDRMLDLVSDLGADDLVIALFSGGGSALMPAPVPGISLAEKQQTTEALLACGAPIEAINAIRKHLSRLKGGQLARLVQPARLVALLISDVIGDRLDTIASGPTHPDATRFADCLQLIDTYGLSDRLPPAVLAHLRSGADGQYPETPKPGDPCFADTSTHVIGNNALALDAAVDAARRCGYTPMVLSSRIAGETRQAAGVLAAIAQQVRTSGQPIAPPACLISGGETTVTLQGDGKGGRNQEFALAAALHLSDWPAITVLSGGTDGTDGPTDAAGAVADGTTVQRARAAGLDPQAHLAANNAYPFFDALGDLIKTGPTNTNVMDLRLFLIP